MCSVLFRPYDIMQTRIVHTTEDLRYYAALLPRRGRILRRTLSVCLSVCLSVRPSRSRMYFVYSCTVLRANIQNRKTSVFAYGPASRMYFSAPAEGRISYGHLGRTNSCLINIYCGDNTYKLTCVFRFHLHCIDLSAAGTYCS